jgi:hypothetical protein
MARLMFALLTAPVYSNLRALADGPAASRAWLALFGIIQGSPNPSRSIRPSYRVAAYRRGDA